MDRKFLQKAETAATPSPITASDSASASSSPSATAAGTNKRTTFRTANSETSTFGTGRTRERRRRRKIPAGVALQQTRIQANFIDAQEAQTIEKNSQNSRTMMEESYQFIRCLMTRERAEEKKKERLKIEPFRGGVFFFQCSTNKTGQYAAWGVWQYYFGDNLCPKDMEITERKDCYAIGPMRQGIFFDDEFIDEDTIDWLEQYCSDNDLGLADLDGFNRAVLLSSQPMRVENGIKVFDKDTPKLICAVDLENQISALSYRVRHGNNTKHDRLGYASNVYELCPCGMIKKRDNLRFRCLHKADVRIKHLGASLSVRAQRSYFDKNENKRFRTLRFLPLDQFFKAMSIPPREYEELPRELDRKSIEFYFSFLSGLHRDYIKARNIFESYKLTIPIWDVYGGGSIARAVLHNIKVAPFRRQNPHISTETLSQFRAAEYGGRIHTIRTGERLEVAHLDFKSQYPAVCILLGLSSRLLYERTEIVESDRLPSSICVNDVAELLDRTRWFDLCGIALVEPHGDWLPIYGPTGLEHRLIESAPPYWVTYPDICASILKTGKKPKVLKCLSLPVMERLQNDLKEGQFFGIGQIDPREEDIFLEAVFAKESSCASKTAVNALSYGVFAQINQQPGPQPGDFVLWCNGLSKLCRTNRKHGGSRFPVEVMGEYWSPFGALIPGGGRLLLTMLELISESYGLSPVYLNTDAAVLERPKSMSIAQFAESIEKICRAFDPLSPYTNQIDIPFVKIEKQNLSGPCDAFQTIYFLAVSRERYAEYTLDPNGIITIRHLSLAHTAEIYDPPNYRPFDLPWLFIVKGACDAAIGRRSLVDAWLILIKLYEQGWRGETLESELRKILETNESLALETAEGRTYAERIVDYLKIQPPKDYHEPVRVVRQFVAGKYADVPYEEALFELKAGKIALIYSGRLAASIPNSKTGAVRLYQARLLIPFIKSLNAPDEWKENIIRMIPSSLRYRELAHLRDKFAPYLSPDEFEAEAERYLNQAENQSRQQEQIQPSACATAELTNEKEETYQTLLIRWIKKIMAWLKQLLRL